MKEPGVKVEILYVESHPSWISTIMSFLSIAGYTVSHYTELISAQKAFAANPSRYAVVLLGGALIGTDDGAEWAAELHNTQKKKVVLLSSGRRIPDVPFVDKGQFSKQELISTIDQVINE